MKTEDRYLIDTHGFLYWLLDPGKLSKTVVELLSTPNNHLYLANISVLEIEYLIEIGRINTSTESVLSYIGASDNFQLINYGFSEMLKSVELKGHRDPFDRIILATAMARSLPVITKDAWMRSNYERCVW